MNMMDYLVRYDILISIPYYLMSVNHYPSGLISFESQRFDVRIDQG